MTFDDFISKWTGQPVDFDGILDITVKKCYTNSMVVTIESGAHGSLEVLIDRQDYDQIKRLYRTIYVSGCRTGLYARVNPTKQYIHRLVMSDVPKGMVVDHINGNTLDNRRRNLRIVTQRRNIMNKHRLMRNNKTGVTGVALHDYGYTAQIESGGKKIHLGLFKTVEAAANARRKAEQLYWQI